VHHVGILYDHNGRNPMDPTFRTINSMTAGTLNAKR